MCIGGITGNTYEHSGKGNNQHERELCKFWVVWVICRHFYIHMHWLTLQIALPEVKLNLVYLDLPLFFLPVDTSVVNINGEQVKVTEYMIDYW
uniref:Uncharacterized protein n=1 Tax=Tetranychus urticae TaxID=32264 RepID=T1JWI1_TETUR